MRNAVRMHLLFCSNIFLYGVYLFAEDTSVEVHCTDMSTICFLKRFSRSPTLYPIGVHLDDLVDQLDREASFPLGFADFFSISTLIVNEV